MTTDSVLDRLQGCLGGATKARDEIEVNSPASQSLDAFNAENQQRLHWLEKQLSSLIAQLQGISLDLESGLSLNNLGYASDDEFCEMLEDIECEVRQIQRMIREVKGLCR